MGNSKLYLDLGLGSDIESEGEAKLYNDEKNCKFLVALFLFGCGKL